MSKVALRTKLVSLVGDENSSQKVKILRDTGATQSLMLGSVLCTDFRKVNDKTKSDSFPIPRITDCIDQIGNAKFVSTFDMLKGYWQVPLTQRAHEISAFV